MDIMIDLETFGTTPGSVIRSIGAVAFNKDNGVVGEGFYANIDGQTCIDLGLTTDKSTVAWWNKPANAKAQAELLIDPHPFRDVAAQFKDWFHTNGGKTVWCQGANFDFPLWEAACRAGGMSAPWRFWNTRDTRTAYDVYDFNPKSVSREGTYHNALADCEHQVECMVQARRSFLGNMALEG